MGKGDVVDVGLAIGKVKGDTVTVIAIVGISVTPVRNDSATLQATGFMVLGQDNGMLMDDMANGAGGVATLPWWALIWTFVLPSSAARAPRWQVKPLPCMLARMMRSSLLLSSSGTEHCIVSREGGIEEAVKRTQIVCCGSWGSLKVGLSLQQCSFLATCDS